MPHRYFATGTYRGILRNGRLLRTRERLFVEHYFRRLVAAFPDLVNASVERIRRARRYLAAASLTPSGYFPSGRVFTMSGEINRTAGKQVDYLLNMPRVQLALSEKFDAAGLSVDRCAAIVAEIASGDARVREQVLTKDGVVELERDVSPADRLRAVDIRVRMTTGYAPTKQMNANVHVGGRLYSEEAWNDTPPIRTTTQDPRNVTPPKTRRGGGSNHR